MKCLSCGYKRSLSEWGNYACHICGFPWDLSTSIKSHIIEQDNWGNKKNENIDRCLNIISSQISNIGERVRR